MIYFVVLLCLGLGFLGGAIWGYTNGWEECATRARALVDRTEHNIINRLRRQLRA